jgi:DNA-directed RNA polymerase subunit RPC12/RpoP
MDKLSLRKSKKGESFIETRLPRGKAMAQGITATYEHKVAVWTLSYEGDCGHSLTRETCEDEPYSPEEEIACPECLAAARAEEAQKEEEKRAAIEAENALFFSKEQPYRCRDCKAEFSFLPEHVPTECPACGEKHRLRGS